MAKFEFKNLEEEIVTEYQLGTGTLFNQISERHFIIVTCAHNFLQFENRINDKNAQNKGVV